MTNIEKLEEMNPGQLIRKTAFPLMLSLVLEGINSIVDGLYLSVLSGSYLTAISLCNPFLLFMNAVSAGIGAGTSDVFAKVLGRKEPAEKSSYILSALLLCVLLWIPFALFTLLLTPVFRSFTADEFTRQAAVQYLGIQFLGCVLLFVMDVVQKLLLSSIHTAAGLMGHVFSAAANLVLDPLLIFGFGPVPSLKIAGAAIASLLSWSIGILIYLILNRKYNAEFPFSFRQARPSAAAIKEISRSVRHSSISHGLPSLMNLGLNKMLAGFSPAAVAFFGIFGKLENICILPVESLEEALIPAASFNAAAEKCLRVKAVYLEALKRALCSSLLSALFLSGSAPLIFQFYHADAALTACGIPGLRILALSLPFSAFITLTSSLFTSARKEPLSVESAFLSRILLLFPLCWLFSKQIGVSGIWIGYTLCQAAGALFCCWRLRKKFPWAQSLRSLFPQRK